MRPLRVNENHFASGLRDDFADLFAKILLGPLQKPAIQHFTLSPPLKPLRNSCLQALSHCIPEQILGLKQKRRAQLQSQDFNLWQKDLSDRPTAPDINLKRLAKENSALGAKTCTCRKIPAAGLLTFECFPHTDLPA